MPRRVTRDLPRIEENPFKDWTTMTDAAKRIGRDPSTVRYWIRRGFIRSHILGKSVILVNMREIEQFSADNPSPKTWKPESKRKRV